MAAQKKDEKAAREARARLQQYEARKEAWEKKRKTRTRNAWIAGGVAFVLVAGAITWGVIAQNAGNTPEAGSSASPSASSSPAPTAKAPDPSVAEDRTWTGDITVNGVDLGIELEGQKAPQAVASFVSLTQQGFYNGLSCHRMVDTPGTSGEPGFQILQCGDPKGDGSGGPGYSFGPIENAPSDNIYPAGTLAMARVGNDANSNGSQFFIVFGDTKIPSDSAGGYTVLGKITSGLDKLNESVTTIPVGGADNSTPQQPIKLDSITVK
ncbi:peptidyl-prolyl cis-trans isomerase B (cyclophilin B) [Mycetocola sp. BIGb0189]|uniref:peptidylprolyl isomerase n=1 Tax=Mycetocola sp. BIGb0189 TaxID=2940604 RepID=UPI00216765FB|nr:peptidylprolyl isomerase [Mycetocola sp. BIGb0189]MCS4277093.1 peptidyl-prolyl cis-trans isomerase B (cyclophilin B) [Mycetocola sp. BIGb0189]